MKSAKQLSLVAFVAVALAARVWAQGILYDKIEIRTEKIAPMMNAHVHRPCCER